MKRREFCTNLAGTAVGVGGLLAAALSPGEAQETGWESRDIVKIHELTANFHLAKSTRDIDLMMSLYTDDALFHFRGATYVGQDQIRTFFLGSGSFTHHRFSLAPAFKTRIQVNDHAASFYFECFDIGDYDTANPVLVSVLFAGGTTRRVGEKWLFSEMTGGSALPISVDHYYFP